MERHKPVKDALYQYLMSPKLALLVFVSSSSLYAQVQQEWVARYRAPGPPDGNVAYAITVDSAGSACVTGRSWGVGTRYDFATVCYDTNGNQVWAARFDGSAHLNDSASAIVRDTQGNVYVTGGSVSVDTGFDYTTIKYDSTGNQLWVALYDGFRDLDAAWAIALDAAGNVYVTGDSRGIGTRDDYATVKYDADGNELWVARYDGPGHDEDIARAIAVDAAGNVYVTGSSGDVDRVDYATIKYDTDGNQLWLARYAGGPGYQNRARAIAVDAAGNVYVTGFSNGTASDQVSDYATVKYDPDGNQLWVVRYGGLSVQSSSANAIALDLVGNVHVTGWTPGIARYAGYTTLKYDGGGSQMWLARYDPTAEWNYFAKDLKLDADGNVYVTGSIGSIERPMNFGTIKYDSDGNEVWFAIYDGPVHQDEPFALALDAQANVYVTGNSANDTGRNSDYVTIKYSQPK